VTVIDPLARQQSAATVPPPDEQHPSASSRVAGMLLGLAAPLALIAALGLLLLMPPWLAFPCGAALYAAIVLSEARCGITSPQSMALLICFACFAIADRIVPAAAPFEAYRTFGVFATLTAVSIALLVLRRPLTLLYAQSRGPRAVHEATSLIWLAAYAAGVATAAAAAAAAPGSWLAFAPLGCALLGATAVLAINLIDFGPAHRREREFELSGFTFREIDRDDDAVDAFLESYAQEIWDATNRDRRTVKRYSREETLDDARWTEWELEDRSHCRYFQAYRDGKVVGGVGVALDRSGRKLPVEKSFGVSFDPLRRAGRIMEVRRLSIAKDYRLQPDIIRGLFKCVIDVALETDAAFIVDFTFVFTAPLLGKVGFNALEAHGRKVYEFGSPMRLSIMNLAMLTVNRGEGISSKESIVGLLNLYLRYRYFQRLALRQWPIPRYRRRAWQLSLADMESLCVPSGDAPRQDALVSTGGSPSSEPKPA